MQVDVIRIKRSLRCQHLGNGSGSQRSVGKIISSLRPGSWILSGAGTLFGNVRPQSSFVISLMVRVRLVSFLMCPFWCVGRPRCLLDAIFTISNITPLSGHWHLTLLKLYHTVFDQTIFSSFQWVYKINIWVQTLQRSPVIPVCTVWRGWWRRPWLTSNLPRPPLESGGLSPDYRRVRVWYCGPRYFDQPRCFIRLAQLWSANITTNWEYALLACIDFGEIVIMEARNGSRKGCLYSFIDNEVDFGPRGASSSSSYKVKPGSVFVLQ